MFNKKFEDRMAEWQQFRTTLETCDDPLQTVVDKYNLVPLVSIQADPWDQSSWPSPWELLKDNAYCPFVKILAICYTLQLTDRLSQSQFEIHITQDHKDIRYLLTVENQCIGYNLGVISVENIPKDLVFEKTYTMPLLQ